MAAKSSLVNMAVCLTAVCLVCAAILGVTYAVTKEPIDNAALAEAQASIAKVLPQGEAISEEKSADVEGILGYYVQTAADGSVSAYAVKTVTGGFGGPVTLMVGVLPDGTVYNTSVLSHAETPGLGAKCTEENSHFREQWKGFKGKLAVTKDGGDIDAITASTITSRAYTKAVAQAVALVAGFSGEETDAASGASVNNKEEQDNG
ncbi:MAG: RnfABCDGE type electron transport complex subunit G [Bacteroidales bacterium]|nr:RnfABCDGE type electron transport complex subunit G [Bacteroidales bacterium]